MILAWLAECEKNEALPRAKRDVMPKYQAVSDNAKEKKKRSFVFEVAVALAALVAGLSTREVLPLVLAVLFPLIYVFTERGWKQIVMGVAAVAAYVSVFGWNIR